ncbi:MAG: sulfite exporter TauE/SafE family protein [Ignavibacteriales bacterium]|nr:sulfite exporter TauE/SafE family protein [Ignavibacteriales bacterium]
MEYLGYFAAILIGVSLGLIGSGGSILTVPVLVYLMVVNPVNATAYSLFIVGLTSLIGSVFYYKKGLINFPAAIVFSIPALIAVFLTRYFILPAIPNELFNFGDFIVTKRIFIMLLFAILMFGAAISMIKKNSFDEEIHEQKFNFPVIFIEGAFVGILTGLVGAGGGFLIIPALVILAKIPMKTAVGTSLIIIAVKSLIGFLGDIGANTEMDWSILIGFSVFAILGIFIGSYLSKFVSSKKLKPAFGWFVLVMSLYIMVKEIAN